MRTLLLSSILALTTAYAPAALACKDGHKKPTVKEEKAENVKSASFRVEKMTCEGCASKIQTALAGTDGIVKVSVKVEDKRVSVDYDADKLSPEKIAKIISDLGYSATAEV